MELRLTQSHCTVFTRDVNTNTPTKPQQTPTPTLIYLCLPLAPHHSFLTQAIKPKKERKPKERRQSAAPAL